MNKKLEDYTFGAVIPAAGRGTRMGGETPKILLDICGRSVIQRAVDTVSGLECVKQIVITAGPALCPVLEYEVTYDPAAVELQVTEGGERRQDSVAHGFSHLSPCDYVIIHDGARPLVRLEDVRSTARAAVEHTAAVLGVRPKATVKTCGEAGNITGTLDRDSLFEAQTPQIFRYDLFKQALEYASEHDIEVTDDAQMVEMTGATVYTVLGTYSNIKITTPEDIVFSRLIAEGTTDG